jgi:biopolymer transport protein ExbD
VAVDAGGAVSVDGDPVSIEAREARLRSRADGADPDVHLHADRAVRHERVVEVMTAARGAGLNRIGFVTEPVERRAAAASRR